MNAQKMFEKLDMFIVTKGGFHYRRKSKKVKGRRFWNTTFFREENIYFLEDKTVIYSFDTMTPALIEAIYTQMKELKWL